MILTESLYERLPKPVLYYCSSKFCGQKLHTCMKWTGKHPGRKCKPERCRDFVLCEIRDKYPTLEAIQKAYLESRQKGRKFPYEVQIINLCNECRKQLGIKK
jgi:hypothetical protein